MKLLDIDKFLISESDSCWEPTLWLLWPDQYILFLLCCIQCHGVQHMRDIPNRVSEELLLRVQVTPYHPHNSVNLPRHLLHSTLHLLLGGVHWGHLVYTLYNKRDNYLPRLIPFEQRNVIDNELPLCHKLLISIPKDKQSHNIQWHISVQQFLC